ncbi:MAG: AMP-binding protein [Gammaproteobacteria bacterium]|nr:AMP-binding protein [Gammaproteobacteria bacterium]
MPADNHQTDKIARELLALIRKLVHEVQPQQSDLGHISLDSTFETDLGLDSLTRVELIGRVEKQFRLALPERSLSEIETARDLLRAVIGAEIPLSVLADSDIQQPDTAEDVIAPAGAQTLVDVLNWHVRHQPDRTHIQLYQDDAKGESVSYARLKAGANKVAAGLQQLGLLPAETVAIMLPSGTDYFYSYFGILIAGGIPVPIYPPARPSQLEDHMRRHARILDNCLAKILITVSEARQVAKLLRSQVVNLQHIITVDQLNRDNSVLIPPLLTSHDVAFIQYTSGSTGNPKGVVLTHANLLANIRAMGQAVEAGPDDVFVSWLPLYHDMGLIGAWLGSLYFAALFVVMQPLSFLARPERWLWAIDHYKGTLSASPNFGYEYCESRINDEDIAGLDLSSWRAAFNGAEAVSPDSIKNFERRFSAYGFKSRSMMPVYGLAESSVGLAFPPLNRGPKIDYIERNKFMRSGEARQSPADDALALKFACSGLPLKNHQIRIVDATEHELPERHEGRIEFRGPSSTSGYYRDAVKTRELFHDGWLDSGDLGYIANGELYVTGRIKDIIIRAGQNIYPHEIEEAVSNVEGVRNGRVAVFGSENQRSKTERLIVLAETHSKHPQEHQRIRRDINTVSTELIGGPPDEVVLAPAGTVLKTSSGKIRRAASREIYEKGETGKTQRSVSLQLARLAVAGVMPRLQRFLRAVMSVSYAGYCLFSYALLAPVVWLTATFSPVFSVRWKVMAFCSRLLAKMTAIQVIVDGLENIPPKNKAYVLVANHASYIDSYVLSAQLPDAFHFIAKSELADSFMTRIPLKNIHTEFVERFDISKSVNDTKHLSGLLKSGHKLMFFAEGTFTRAPGLLPFYLGAFSVAANANVPVVPIAIRGTRSILRNGSLFPRHGSIHIEIGDAIYPRQRIKDEKTDNWQRAIGLRDQSREFILRHCGEPDLSQRG